MKVPKLGLQGRIRVDVLNPVRGNRIGKFQNNLILDQGLNQLADTLICDLFLVAVKGIGDTGVTSDAVEAVDVSNSFSITNGSTTVSRVAGARDFTADDEGKLIRFQATGFETVITAFTDATHVEVFPEAPATETAQDIKLYAINQVGLDGEIGRTSEYSVEATENFTETVDNVRTFQRTFLFPSENVIVETPPFTNTYSQSGTTVTRVSGSRNFTIADVGKSIRFRTTGQLKTISAYTDATHVTVSNSQSISAQNIDLLEDDDLEEVPAGTNTYSRSVNTVTRVAGSRAFTADDVGKIIYFLTAGVESKITTYNSATSVDVEDAGTVATQNIALYGFRDYTEFGFSHLASTGDNLNVRIKTASPVRVNGSTPITPSDQLKVYYALDLTVEPSSEQTGDLGSVIVDPSNSMSVNKTGKYGLECFATSTVESNGETGVSLTGLGLEPSYAGYMGLAYDPTQIQILDNQSRTVGAAYTPLTAAAYVDGSFERTYSGVFGLNQAVYNAWRSLMIAEPETGWSIFTFVFNSPQNKDSSHSLAMTFKKSWGRVLP